MKILLAAATMLITTMPFPCKICTEPWKFFKTKNTNQNQSYFANILVTLDEKPLNIKDKTMVMRLTVAPSFDLPHSNIMVFKDSKLSVVSKTLKGVSKNVIPLVITKSKNFERDSSLSKNVEREIELMMLDLNSEERELKTNLSELEEDGDYILIEIADCKSKKYFFKITKDNKKKWYQRITESLETIEY